MDKITCNSTKETISTKIQKFKKRFTTVYKYRLPGCNLSRADRFSPCRFNFSAEFSTIPNTIGTGRKAGFGFGGRHVFRNPNGKDAPPCNLYNIPSCFDKIVEKAQSPRIRTAFSTQRNSKACGSPSGLSKLSSNKAKYSTDTSFCVSGERHLTPGPRRTVY